MKRAFALWLVAGWIAAATLDTYHLAHAPHVACLEHGDVVEGSVGHDELGDGLSSGAQRGIGHHHCDAALLSLSTALPAQRVLIASPTFPFILATAANAVEAGAVDRAWLWAPKHSPPHL